MMDKIKVGHKGLHITHLNVGRLVPNFDMVKQDIVSQAMHIATISETWLKDEHPSALVDIPGYQFIRQDRKGVKSTKGGGLAAYINENCITDTTSWAHLNQISDAAQMLWIEIKPGDLKKILLGIIYRPPGSNRLQFLEDFKEKLDAIKHIGDREVHITGDFNMDTLDTTNTSKGKTLLQLAKGYGLQQYITTPTHVIPTRSSILDLYFTNCQFVSDSGVTHSNISDHEQIFLYKKKAPIIKKRYHFRAGSIESMTRGLWRANYGTWIGGNYWLEKMLIISGTLI